MPTRRGLRCLEHRREFIGIPKPAVVHLTSFGIGGWLWTILVLQCSSGPWQIYQKPLLRGARPLGKPRFALSWSCACDAGSERGPHMCGYLRFSDKGTNDSIITRIDAPTKALLDSSTHNGNHRYPAIPSGLVGSGVVQGKAGAIPVRKGPGKQVCGRDISKVLAQFVPSS